METTLETRIAEWQERIGNASVRFGGAQICAVTKTIDAATINRAWDCGIRIIGENRVQELLSKQDALDPRYTIHLIGTLQTNKAKSVIGRAAVVQSLDRPALAQELSRRALAAGTVQDTLVQVNIGREIQKSGIDEEELVPFLKTIPEYPGIRVCGLMAIMPAVDDPEDIRPLFRRMREWFERLRDASYKNVSMNTLSMGMTDDCIVAAEEGATMVRLGRALFGARGTAT